MSGGAAAGGGAGDEVGAVVLLRTPSGDRPAPEDLVAAHIGAVTPAPAEVERVAGWFRSRGFTVDPPVGPTFAVSGPPALYERTFGAPAPPGGEYPVASLPPDIAARVASVSRPEPPAFR